MYSETQSGSVVIFVPFFIFGLTFLSYESCVCVCVCSIRNNNYLTNKLIYSIPEHDSHLE